MNHTDTDPLRRLLALHEFHINLGLLMIHLKHSSSRMKWLYSCKDLVKLEILMYKSEFIVEFL